jgi:ribosomal protein S18 acetylase RimI-like enzyme
MPPTLREFRWRTDRDEVLGFQAEIYETNFPGFQVGQAFLRDYEAQIRKALRHPGERLMVLADEDGLCGFMWLALVTTMVEAFVGYIKSIYIAPRLRSKGYARMMLSAADEWFRQQGCRKASLDASACNPHAIDVYEAAGYQPVRYRMEKALGAEGDEGLVV